MARSSRFAGVVRGAVARRGAALMGICNVTPDSFSDGGRYYTLDAARGRVDQLLAEGADIIDIGGESTRPGSKPVPPEVQNERVLPIIAYASERGACISIDTTHPAVAAAGLAAGAHALNDVSLLADPDLARVVADHGAAYVLSHARVPQEQMAGGYPLDGYGDVVLDVVREWEDAAARAEALGVKHDALVFDPGLGFSKAARHSFELLRQMRRLVASVDVPVLVGASRKSFLTLIEKSPPAGRDGASIAAALHSVENGAQLLRVHDVRATRQAIDLTNALATARRKI
jgi:dihydropteroate synthase